jgi:hypothetical protein
VTVPSSVYCGVRAGWPIFRNARRHGYIRRRAS